MLTEVPPAPSPTAQWYLRILAEPADTNKGAVRLLDSVHAKQVWVPLLLYNSLGFASGGAACGSLLDQPSTRLAYRDLSVKKSLAAYTLESLPLPHRSVQRCILTSDLADNRGPSRARTPRVLRHRTQVIRFPSAIACWAASSASSPSP